MAVAGVGHQCPEVGEGEGEEAVHPPLVAAVVVEEVEEEEEGQQLGPAFCSRWNPLLLQQHCQWQGAGMPGSEPAGWPPLSSAPAASSCGRRPATAAPVPCSAWHAAAAVFGLPGASSQCGRALL